MIADQQRAPIDADLAALVLIHFRENPGNDWTVHQVWARLSNHRYPLGAVNGVCKRLAAVGVLACNRLDKTRSRVRLYRLAEQPGQQPAADTTAAAAHA